MESPIQNEPRFAPVCHACKAQNETLRAVTLPFVFSVVFMTFRRNFSGIYCRKHRRLYHLLASVITAIFGWLGIPFGLVWTPLTLIHLARGGTQNPRENFELLTAVADKKLLDGDAPGAIRCLEESLRFEDDPVLRGRLANLYQSNRLGAKLEAPGIFLQVWGVFVTLALAALLGIFAGFFDALLTSLLFPFYDSSSSIFVAMLSWAPFVVFMCLGAVALQSLVGAHLTRNRLPSRLLVIALSIATAFAFFYNILETQFVFRNVQRLIEIFTYSSKDGYFALRSILSLGAFFLPVNNIAYSSMMGYIHLALVLAGFGLCLYACLTKGNAVVRWQARLEQVRGMVEMREENSALVSWGTLAVMLIFPLLVIGLLVPGKIVNVERASILISEGLALGNQYDYDLASVKLNEAVEIWPDSVMAQSSRGLGLMGVGDYDGAYDELQSALEIDPQSMGANFIMGFVQTARGDFADATSSFKIVAAIQSSWALPHAILATLYYQLDDVSRSNAELQSAITYGANDSQSNSYIASYYLQLGDYEAAEKYALQAIKLGSLSSDYLTLARIYIAQEEYERAEKTISEAERLNARPLDLIVARSVLAQSTEDIEKAEALLLEGVKVYPDESELLSDLSAVHFDMGRIEQAMKDAQQAIELNRYNGSAYIELAFAYQAQGRTAEALEAANTGLRFMPKYDRAHYVLGLCYMDKGMKAEAVKEFEMFLDLFRNRSYMMDEKALAEKYIQQLK